jgi:DNA-binding NarL/FixJ family response regulator
MLVAHLPKLAPTAINGPRHLRALRCSRRPRVRPGFNSDYGRVADDPAQVTATDGPEATRQIVADERLDSVRVVILTNFGLDEYIFRALRAGASGFLLKDTEPAELLQALRVVMRGDSLLSPAVTRRLISEFTARPPDAVAAAGMESLTNREREVVALVAHGLSNDEIAEALVLSPATAKTHVSRAMIKLGARDRAQLVVFAYQAGLVSPRTAG